MVNLDRLLLYNSNFYIPMCLLHISLEVGTTLDILELLSDYRWNELVPSPNEIPYVVRPYAQSRTASNVHLRNDMNEVIPLSLSPHCKFQ